MQTKLKYLKRANIIVNQPQKKKPNKTQPATYIHLFEQDCLNDKKTQACLLTSQILKGA